MGDDGASEPIPGEPHAPRNLELASTRPSLFQRYGLSESWRYGSANWRRIMRPLLADWDLNYASDAERELVRERGWDGIA